MSEQILLRAPTEWRCKKNYHVTSQRKEGLLLSGRATGPLFLTFLIVLEHSEINANVRQGHVSGHVLQMQVAPLPSSRIQALQW